MNRDLELAKRVFPDVPYQYDEMHEIVYDPRCGARFYPLDTHFPDVLAWLACQTDVHINGDCVATQRSIHDYKAGSGVSIAYAVYEAAIRIVEAE